MASRGQRIPGVENLAEQTKKRRRTLPRRSARGTKRRSSTGLVLAVLSIASGLIVLATACGGDLAATSSPEPEAVPPTAAATPNVARDVARGKRLAQEKTCLGCHTTDGRDQVGPTWRGLYGKKETLQSGATVEVDEAYLNESILDPNSELVQGFLPDIMPSVDLTRDEINAIVAFIKSLQ